MNLNNVVSYLNRNYFKDKKIIKFEEILKGYSFDKKFYIEDEYHKKYLLRISDLKTFDQKEKEFQVMTEIKKFNVKMSKPFLIDKLPDEGICFQLLSYLEGESAFEALQNFDEATQYKIGFEAGIELKKMHALHAPSHYTDWYIVKTNKNNRYMKAYHALNYHIKGEKEIFEFIRSNLEWMKNRPNRFQHDDFHVGNIIINRGMYEGVIDFNRYDYGDPMHDFYKIMFSREISIPFSIGQIEGYFNYQIPDYFWNLYTLYTALNFVPSIVWTVKYYPEDLKDMENRLNRIYEEQKGFTECIPTWYQKNK